MGYKCCAVGCNNNNKDYPMHTFPKDEALYLRWIRLVGRDDLLVKPMQKVRRSYRVCQVHFGPDADYIGTYYRSTIRRNAIPSLFLQNNIPESEKVIEEEVQVQKTHPNLIARFVPTFNTSILEELSAEPMQEPEPKLFASSPLQDTSKRLTKRFSLFSYITAQSSVQLFPTVDVYYNIAVHFRKIARQLETCTDLKLRIKNIEKVVHSSEFLKAQVNQATYDFIISELKRQGVNPKQQRFSLDEMLLFLTLLKQNFKSYKLMQKIFTTPSRSALTAVLQRIPFNPGINVHIMNSLSEKVASLEKEERYCSVIFDVMSLEPALQYNKGNDLIDGFQDYGYAESKKILIADKVYVFMARGIYKDWKQPLAYYFNVGKMQTIPLVRSIRDVVRACQSTGLCVKALICGQSTSNVAAINELYKQTRDHFRRIREENQIFGVLIGEQEVVPLYDPPHLLRSLRNNFFSYDIRFQWRKDGVVEVAKWKYLRYLYNGECTEEDDYQLCPNLTLEHINKPRKAKVSLAAQVFSRRVAALMRRLTVIQHFPKEASSTAEFLLFVDKLFDSVNGTTTRIIDGKRLRCAITATSEHIEFWKDAINVLKTIRFVSDKPIKVTSLTAENWIHTLQGLSYLWNDFHEMGMSFLRPRNFNLDPLENFFSCIRTRGKRNVKPTPTGFVNFFKALILNDYFPNRTALSNCEKDTLKPLDNLKGFLTSPEKLSAHSGLPEFPVIMIPEYIKCESTLLRRGKLTSVAIVTIEKVLSKTKTCKQCIMDLVGADESDINFQTWNQFVNVLMSPSTQFNSFFQESIFYLHHVLPRIYERVYITKNLEVLLETVFENRSFQCTNHNLKDLLIQCICRFYLFMWIRNTNLLKRRKIKQKKTKRINGKLKNCSMEM